MRKKKEEKEKRLKCEYKSRHKCSKPLSLFHIFNWLEYVLF